ncbi:Calcium-transporting ATPase 10, plasma membrane-type [Aspergillus wentii]|nr:Calcium-transporting ATPase 10, plasma membrane-type [Aspergillus wentii]
MDTSLSNLPYDDVPLSEALSPDPQHEHDFEVENNNFAFTPGQLNKLLNPKSLAAFQALGGPHGLAYGLRTDLTVGLSVDEGEIQDYVSLHAAQEMALSKSASWQPISFAGSGPVFISHGQSSTQFCDRIRVFGRNRLPEPRRKGFWRLLWDACNDKIIILLTIAAVISLSLGIYEAAVGQSKVDWIEGVSICVAVLIVVTVTAGNDWQKERQFGKLNKRKADRDVKAVRSGQPAMVHITDITVGDVLCIEPGDSPPADGILITGHGVKCDESTATGESDQIRKISSEEVWRRIVDGTATKDLDPFILSGSKVLEGVGTYLVTSVGRFSTHGRIMSSLQTENDPTPLQVKLGRLANWIGGLGTASVNCFPLSGNNESSAIKGQEFMDILIVAVTVIVVAIPVTLALAFATTRMVKENNLVRVLRACETMGNATVICSDKTGTLTQNQMTVVAGVFGDNIQFNNMEMAVEDKQCYQTITDTLTYFPAALKALAVKAIALNSTAFEEFKDGARQFVGDKTEVALLEFANDHLQMNFAEERPHSRVVHVFPFDSNQKCMGTVYYDHSIGYRLLVKGAAEIMLRSSTEIIAQQANQMLTRKHLDSDTREALTGKIDQYAGLSLRAIAMVYRDFPDWPPQALEKNEDSELRLDSLMADMVWIGAVGIHDPLRPEASAAIKICRTAGVQIKMVTGDNIKTASAIASSCGIKTPDGIIMEGPAFRKLPPEAIDTILPKLQVLARSSPDDKRILVDHLKHLGETVAVTGDGTNDGPALKSADVGFSMGISGTEVAKEASSIILLDDNFKSIVTAIAWAIYSNSNESVLNAVQLLWVNLIMDTFAALAFPDSKPKASSKKQPLVYENNVEDDHWSICIQTDSLLDPLFRWAPYPQL